MSNLANTMQQAPRASRAARSRSIVGRSSARREHTRSRKGCAECRKRKVKCDETHPTCGQCRRNGRSCSIIDGLFRQHPFSLSVNSAQSGGGAHPSAIESTDRETTENVTSSPTQQAVFITSGTDSPEEPSPEPVPHQPWSGEQTGNPHSPEEHLDFGFTAAAPPDTTHAHIPLPPQQTEHWREANDTLNGNSYRTPETHNYYRTLDTHNESLHSITPAHRPASDYSSLASYADEENEISFLLRQFSEGLGKRMDLLTNDKYFSRQVLLCTRRNSLIKYAACAVAAKQLGQMSEAQPHMRPTKGQQRVMHALENSGNDYLWYGAKYYEKAIQALADGISQAGQNTLVPSPSGVYGGLAAATARSAYDEDIPDAQLVAACLMCQYEELSATMRAWSSHITGIFKLLQLDGRALSGTPAPSPSDACQSLFWYLVLNDLDESYASQRQTRIDTADIPLWRRMGVPLDDSGYFNGVQPDSRDSREDTTLRTLIRLVCKIVNYGYATGETSVPGREAAWTNLKYQFDTWSEGLPSSFRPDAILARDSAEHNISSLSAREVWFSNNTCAMGSMYYHTARMLLLVWKPSTLLGNSGAVQNNFDILRACRAMEQDLRSHAKEILSIALGMSSYAVQIRMVQPLYVAGRCLTEKSDQLLLVELLRNIEQDFGLATEYRIDALKHEWGVR